MCIVAFAIGRQFNLHRLYIGGGGGGWGVGGEYAKDVLRQFSIVHVLC